MYALAFSRICSNSSDIRFAHVTRECTILFIIISEFNANANVSKIDIYREMTNGDRVGRIFSIPSYTNNGFFFLAHY